MSILDDHNFSNWSEKAKAQALAEVKKMQESEWRPFFCDNPLCDGLPHGNWDFNHARSDQWPPNWSGKWLTWLLMSGRGAGKTRTGSEIINKAAEHVGRMALVGATGPDLRETMIEGPSGILACAPPGKLPTWEPSRRRLIWPNGAVAQGYSGEEPDRIRGGNFELAWVDEPAHIDLIEEVWKNLTLALRIGENPHIICTTTPKPIPWIKKLVADKRTITVKVSTYKNLDNLSPVFRQTVLDSYEGTRWGRQELHGEILEDVEGSLWKGHMIRYVSEEEMPELDRIVVAVDPAGSANARSDLTGIIVMGLSGRSIYVLEDRSGKYSPNGWASEVYRAFESWKADAIVAEKNYGGDMVRSTLEHTGRDIARIIDVDSRRGKALRAEPIVGMYEKERVFHVPGMDSLESEMVEWIPGKGPSPNRVDALVHGATDLVKRFAGPMVIADPNRVLKGRHFPTGYGMGERNMRGLGI